MRRHELAEKNKKKKKKKKKTWQDAAGRAGSGVPRASPHRATSDAGAAPLAPRPCFPGTNLCFTLHCRYNLTKMIGEGSLGTARLASKFNSNELEFIVKIISVLLLLLYYTILLYVCTVRVGRYINSIAACVSQLMCAQFYKKIKIKINVCSVNNS